MHPVFFAMRNVYEETMNLAGRKQMSGSRKAGFTLIELLVYIGIVGIIVIVAGQAFSNSTKMRVRTQSMLKASEVAENVAALFKVDVAQMGAKSSLESHSADGSSDVFSGVKESVYIDPDNASDESKDSSSFQYVPENPSATGNLQKFIMRRVRYSGTGSFEAVEQVTWSLQGKTLSRTCVILDGTAGDNCAPKNAEGDDLDQFTTEIATGVDSFKVLPAIPAATEGDLQIFPSASGSGTIRMVSRVGTANVLPLDAGEGGESVTLKGFASNYNEASDEIPAVKKLNEVYVLENSNVEGSWSALCGNSANHFTFVQGREYELSFNVTVPEDATEKSKMFVPGKDHMAVGFRHVDGEKVSQIPDFIFYPPSVNEANSAKRVMRFSVAETVENVCAAFTFSFFTPVAANGSLSIGDFRIKRVASATYNFNPTTTSVSKVDKKNVKAFLLRLKVKRDGEAGAAEVVIPTPSNGPKD